MKKIMMLVLFTVALTGCSNLDPSVRDLKSPCVSNGSGDFKDPCVRRKPLENYVV